MDYETMFIKGKYNNFDFGANERESALLIKSKKTDLIGGGIEKYDTDGNPEKTDEQILKNLNI